MANANTVSRLAGLAQGNVTSESAFPSVAGGSVRAVLAQEVSSTAAQLPAISASPIAGAFDGVPFLVTAHFKVTAASSGNITCKLYWNSGSNTNLTTFTNDVLLISSGTVATGGVDVGVSLTAKCLWDSGSQQLMATQVSGLTNIGTPAVLNSGAETITSTNPVATGLATVDKLQFFATALFGTSHSTNAVTLVELCINAL